MTIIDQHRQLHRRADQLLWSIDCCKTKITMHRRVIAERDTTGMNPETVARLNAASERQIANLQAEREQLWQQYGELVAEIADATFTGIHDTVAPTLERQTSELPGVNAFDVKPSNPQLVKETV